MSVAATGAGPGATLGNNGLHPRCHTRVALKNLGCRLNRVELDRIAQELEDVGCVLVGEREADVVVVNSCAVTGEAETKCRKAIRHAAGLPQVPAVIVCGCLVTLSPDEVEALGPQVHVVSDKRRVAAEVISKCGVGREGVLPQRPHQGARPNDIDDQACPRGEHPLPATRSQGGYPLPDASASVTPTGRTRPGVKIQDGCDNRCTFCVVWRARGASRSVAPERVLDEIRAACDRGAREVVLSGINLGSYRWERGKVRLPGLLERILAETDVERVRLSSIEPPDVDEALVRLMGESEGRIAPYLHMCLQAGCDSTLRRMGRVYDTALYRERVELARAAIPQLALGCDLIVGFPGETDGDFRESYAFCDEMAFAHMHIFRYSARPGTPAASMDGQITPHVKAERSERMRELADHMAHEYAASLVGIRQQILVQEPGRGVTGGLVEALVPDSLPVGELVTFTPHEVLSGTALC